MTELESAVAARLRELGIPYTRHEHPPVATVDEAQQYWSGIDATHCKNLFLRNQKGNRHYLVILVHAKKADLRKVADQVGWRRQIELRVARTVGQVSGAVPGFRFPLRPHQRPQPSRPGCVGSRSPDGGAALVSPEHQYG